MCAKKQNSATSQSLPVGDSASYQSRPRRKADHSVKGTMKTWNGTNYCEFHPVGTRESNRTEIKRVGDSSFCKNEGQKESSYSLHLNVDGESQDPVAEMYDLFMHLTEDQRKALPKLPEGSQGRMLLDNGVLKIWLDIERGKLSILTELECSANIERMLLQVESQMSVTVARYRQDILNSIIK